MIDNNDQLKYSSTYPYGTETHKHTTSKSVSDPAEGVDGILVVEPVLCPLPSVLGGGHAAQGLQDADLELVV